MFPIFLSNKTCRLEHVVNKLMSCLITEFLWMFSYKLHGILSNSMDTLWHSMELHWYLREPRGIPWNSTIFHGISWHSMGLYQYFMELRRTPWHSMELHGYTNRESQTPRGTVGKFKVQSGITTILYVHVFAIDIERKRH